LVTAALGQRKVSASPSPASPRSDDPSEQRPVAFVRKANRRTGVKAGILLAALGNSLTRLEEPVLTLEDHFDLIVSERGVISLHQGRFEQLFRETPALQTRIPE
jgi:hypothetical protein